MSEHETPCRGGRSTPFDTRESTSRPFPLRPFPLRPFPPRPLPLSTRSTSRPFPLRPFPLRPFPLRPFPPRPFPLSTRSTSRPFPLRRGTLVRHEVVSHTERRSANERQCVGNRRPTEELDPHACHDGCRLSSACPFQLLQPRDGSVRAARVCVHAWLPRVQCMRAYRSGYQLRAAPSVLVSLVYRRAHCMACSVRNLGRSQHCACRAAWDPTARLTERVEAEQRDGSRLVVVSSHIRRAAARARHS